MNPQELAELDFAVAESQGMIAFLETENVQPFVTAGANMGCLRSYSPSRNPNDAMWLHEKYKFSLQYYFSDGKEQWNASFDKEAGWLGRGETICIAICRAVLSISAAPAQ